MSISATFYSDYIYYTKIEEVETSLDDDSKKQIKVARVVKKIGNYLIEPTILFWFFIIEEKGVKFSFLSSVITQLGYSLILVCFMFIMSRADPDKMPCYIGSVLLLISFYYIDFLISAYQVFDKNSGEARSLSASLFFKSIISLTLNLFDLI